METIASRIRRLLTEKNISERELSRRAGFKTGSQLNATLKRLDGDPLSIELTTLDAIAKGLGVTSLYLQGGDDDSQAVEVDAETPTPPPHVVEGSDIMPATFASLPNIRGLLAYVEEEAPDMPRYVIEQGLRASPQLVTAGADVSPAAFLAVLRVIRAHKPPPPRGL